MISLYCTRAVWLVRGFFLPFLAGVAENSPPSPPNKAAPAPTHPSSPRDSRPRGGGIDTQPSACAGVLRLELIP